MVAAFQAVRDLVVSEASWARLAQGVLSDTTEHSVIPFVDVHFSLHRYARAIKQL